MSKIVVKNLTKIFGSNPERGVRRLKAGATKAQVQKELGLVVGVHDVSFAVEEGETFVVMGLSGSGKSTLLRCLNRLHEPTAGSIEVDGVDITKLGRRELLQVRRRKFGMVFQNFALLPHRTVLGNTEYGLEVQGVPASERRQKALDAIELVGLKGWEDRYPSELSGGMQQRVGLARALAIDPDVLLMDEAFSALDPLIRREMQDEMLELQARMNKTIVFITHDLDEALKLGDRIAVMRDGEIIQLGTPEEIVSSPADDYVAAFTEGVDRSKVLTAASIMQRPKEVATLRDGPQIVLRKLRQNGLSSIFLVDRERRIVGLLEADAVAKLVREGGTDLKEALSPTFPAIGKETPLREVMEFSAGVSGPIAVVDEAARLVGVIVKGAILAALVQHGENGGITDGIHDAVDTNGAAAGSDDRGERDGDAAVSLGDAGKGGTTL